MREKTVHIYRPAHQAERKELKKSEQLLNWGMKSVSVALLTAAWWRCLASVFEIQIKKQSLGIWICFYCFIWTAIWLSRWKKYALPAAGCFSVLVIWKNQIVFIRVLNHFANAVIRLREEANESIGFYQEAGGSQEQMAAAAAFIIMPIIIIWAFVICSGRGRIISLLLIILPTVAAAALAYFPSKSSCLTLLLSTGVYMALCSGNWGKALAGRGIAAAVLLFAMLLLASKIGDRIEVQKALYEMEYQQARTQINETVIKKLEIIAKKDTTERQKEETLREPEIQENETNQGRSGARNQAGTYSDSSMSDLKALESYQPSQNTESYLITVEKKPVETLYYPERYGGI